MMKSPFPGMDPYLEADWPNVHALMIGALTGALNVSLPPQLRAKAEEELRVETLSGERIDQYRGDVAVVQGKTHLPGVTAAMAGTIARPIRLAYKHAPMILRDIHIVDTSASNRIVTVVEVLSPWNKLAGKLNQKYVRKLRQFEDAGTNWVEIDLLRSSRQRLPVRWKDFSEADRSDYLVTTCRSDDESVSAYPVSVRESLPTVLIPLREVDADVPLNLQQVFERVYTEGRFASVDYFGRPVPPLSPADAEWAAGLVAKRQITSDDSA